MNFQSILAFIFIAAISSLFNNKKQPPARDFKGTPVREATGPQKRSATSLEDLLGGLRKELQDVFGEFTSNAPAPTAQQTQHQPYLDEQADQGYVEEKRREFRTGTEISNPAPREEDPIYQNEIGKDTNIGALSFHQRSLVEGIMMAEVLGKPKALRK